jgi:hypothetical protein
MKKKYLVWGAIATIGAILIYTWKKNQDKEDKKNEESNDVNSGTPKSESASQQNTSNTGSSPQGSGGGKNPDAITMEEWNKPTGFTEAQGNQFRAWFNDNYPELAKAFDLDRTGKPDNATIRKVYYKYKGEWNKYLASKNQANATANATANQAKLNKEMLDKLQFALTGNSAVTPLSDSSGRILRLAFYKTWSGENMRIVFFEMKSGKKPAYYYIKNSNEKIVKQGSWAFNGTTYDFVGTGVKGNNLLECIKKLVGENVAYGEK